AGQAPEGGRMLDAVAVALEAGAQRIGFLGPAAVPGPNRAGGAGGGGGLLGGLAVLARPRRQVADLGVAVDVGPSQRAPGVAGHGGRPAPLTLARFSSLGALTHVGDGTRGVGQQHPPGSSANRGVSGTPRVRSPLTAGVVYAAPSARWPLRISQRR